MTYFFLLFPSLHQFFKKTFIPARRRLSFVDVSIRRFAFEGWISAGALQNRSREGEEVEGPSLSLTDIRQRDWLNGITCRPLRPAPQECNALAWTWHASAKRDPRRMLMPRPRKSETSTGATFATPSGTPTGISWRFNSARSDVPRVRDDFDDPGRG